MSVLLYSFACLLFRLYYKLVFLVKVTGREHLKGHDGYIVAVNHFHWRDPLIIGAMLFPQRYHFMSKKENFKSRFLAGLLGLLGAFSVDRSGNDVGSIKTSISLLKAGKNLGIFPEGTRNKGDRPLPVKGGMVMLAYKTGKPIVPVTISDYRPFRRTHITIGTPIDVTARFSEKPSGDDYDRLAEEILDGIYAVRQKK
ncbi:MAG: lysophospholipid acyltransferase family protein [Bacillota bacterium]|nr:lysophospholipid acyltransferase family protein [Bacillota bacterium]